MATQALPVGPYAKVVNVPEQIFSQSIGSATYIAYSSDRNVVGFQLNGTADGMMLDALPGLAGGSNANDNIQASKTIGTAGGTVQVDNPTSPIQGTKIDIPADALATDTLITVKQTTLDRTLPPEATIAGNVVYFGPSGTTFDKDVVVTMKYNDADNDGFIDGTNIPEDNVQPVYYDEEMGKWLYLRKISQDKVNKTITFATSHFSTMSTVSLPTCPNGPARIFTIDGLSFSKTFDGKFTDMSDYRPAYLKPALLSGMNLGLADADVYSYRGNSNQSWSGDAGNTSKELPVLISLLQSEYNNAINAKKKFIVVTHSWGTVWGFLALKYSTVKPDLFITLSSPMGSIYYGSLLPSTDEVLISSWTVSRMDEAVTSMTSKKISPSGPYFSKWINYGAYGDLFSGKLSPWGYSVTDYKIDGVTSLFRNVTSTIKYHKITSLGGTTNEATDFRSIVEKAINDVTGWTGVNITGTWALYKKPAGGTIEHAGQYQQWTQTNNTFVGGPFCVGGVYMTGTIVGTSISGSVIDYGVSGTFDGTVSGNAVSGNYSLSNGESGAWGGEKVAGVACDMVRPVVVSTIPANGATSVSRSLTQITVTFKEAMGPGRSVTTSVSWPISNATPYSWDSTRKIVKIGRDNSGSGGVDNSV